MEQAKKLKDLQKENAQLKRALATLTLEKQILTAIPACLARAPAADRDVTDGSRHGSE